MCTAQFALVLAPLTVECGKAVAGYEACSAAYTVSASHITPGLATAVSRCAAVVRGAGDIWRDHSSYVRGRLVQMDAERMAPGGVGVGDTPAYETCLGKTFPAEKLVKALASAVQSAAAHNAGIVGRGGGEGTWVEEIAQVYKLTLQLMARVLALIAQAQMGTLRNCLAIYVRSLDALVAYSVTVAAAWDQREGWMRELIRTKGPGQACSPPQIDRGCSLAFHEHLRTPAKPDAWGIWMQAEPLLMLSSHWAELENTIKEMTAAREKSSSGAFLCDRGGAA